MDIGNHIGNIFRHNDTAPADQTKTKIQIDPQAELLALTPQVDVTTLNDSTSVQQGKAIPSISMVELPEWSANTKKTIVTGFNEALKQNNMTVNDLNRAIKRLGIVSTQWDETKIQDPANAPEIKRLQTVINEKINTKALKELGISHKTVPDGQFGKYTVNNIVSLQCLLPVNNGKPVSLNVDPIKQPTKTGCYKTSEAMLFNYVHNKTGKPDAYTEFDLRSRVKCEDRDVDSASIKVKSESDKGRVSINRESGLKAVKTINDNLDKNYPVVIGVSYKVQTENNDGITDHFLLVTGRGYDENGFYLTFNDSARGTKDNKLRLDPITGKMSGRCYNERDVYDMTCYNQYSFNPEIAKKYEAIGKIEITAGQRGIQVKDLQQKLTDLGYDTKGVAGRYNTTTESAVEKFQEDQNLPVTGIVDTYTMQKIENQYFTKFPDKLLLQVGSSGDQVLSLQKMLKTSGFLTGKLDNAYGNNTKIAVEKFQQANNLTVTGMVDVKTLYTLKSVQPK